MTLLERTQIIRRVQFTIAWVFFANLAVALAKLYWGRRIHSIALQADGYHSMLDAAANIIGFIGVTASHQPADEGHPYGHRKYETFAALAVAVLVLETAITVFRDAWERLSGGGVPASPTVESLLMVVVALGVNIAVTVLEKRAGERLHSDFLVADATHTLSDVFVSVGVLSGLGLVMAGLPNLDAVVAIAVVVVIALAGFHLLQRTVPVLVDAEAIPAGILEPVILAVAGIESCHKIRSRGRPDDVQVDLHVQVNPSLSVREAHSIAHRVKAALMERFPQISDATIHVEPVRREE